MSGLGGVGDRRPSQEGIASAEALQPRGDHKGSPDAGPVAALPGQVAERAAHPRSEARDRGEGADLRDRKVEVQRDAKFERDGKRTEPPNPVAQMLRKHDRQFAMRRLRESYDWQGMNAQQCWFVQHNRQHLTLEKLVNAIGRQQVTVQGLPVDALDSTLFRLIEGTPAAASVEFLRMEAVFARDPSHDWVNQMLERFNEPPAGSGIPAEKWSALMDVARNAEPGAALSHVFAAARDEVNKALTRQGKLMEAAMYELRSMVGDIVGEQVMALGGADSAARWSGAGDRKQAWPVVVESESVRITQSAGAAGTRINQLLANLGGTPAMRRATSEELLIIASDGRAARAIVELMGNRMERFARDAVEDGARNGAAQQLLHKLASTSGQDWCVETIYAGLQGEGLTALVKAAMTPGEGPNVALDLVIHLSATVREVSHIRNALKGANMGVLIPLALDQHQPQALQLLSNLVRADATLHEGIRDGITPVRWQALEADALGQSERSKSVLGFLSALRAGGDGVSGARSVMQNLSAAGVRTLVYSNRADHRTLLEGLSRSQDFAPIVLEKLGPAGLNGLVNSAMAAPSAASTRAIGMLKTLASHRAGFQRIADALGTPRALKVLAGKLTGPGALPEKVVELLNVLARGDAALRGRIFTALGSAGLRAVARMSFDSASRTAARELIEKLAEGHAVRQKACDKAFRSVA